MIAKTARSPRPGAAAAPAKRRAIPSHLLFGPAQEVVILHSGQEYRLRCTRSGKLILNK